jgi:hypothetical protein
MLNGGEGAGPSGWGAALGSGEALGPTYGERGGVKWLDTNEVAENRGEARPGRLTEGWQRLGHRQMSGRGFLLSSRITWGQRGPTQGGTEGGEGSARRQSDGSARARSNDVVVAATLRGGDTEGVHTPLARR